MKNAFKRVLRLDYETNEYLLCFLNGEVVTTRLPEYALDVTNIPTHQLEKMFQTLFRHGYEGLYLATYGLDYVDAYGIEHHYEEPFQRTNVENMLKFTLQDLKGEKEF